MGRSNLLVSTLLLMPCVAGCASDNPVASTVGDGSSRSGSHEESMGDGADDGSTSAGSEDSGNCDVTPEGGYFVAEAVGALVPAFDEDEELLDLFLPEGRCGDFAASPSYLRLLVYRPQTSPGTTAGTWPEGRFPVLIFHHGIGQAADLYDHVFRPLVEDGFVIANVDIAPSGSFDVEQAANAMACVVRFLVQDWEDAEHVGCGVSLMGHSRGGESAILAIGPVLDDATQEVHHALSLSTPSSP
jgi:hypothetical protein